MCGDAPSGRVWGEGAGGWADSSLGLRGDDRSSPVIKEGDNALLGKEDWELL